MRGQSVAVVVVALVLFAGALVYFGTEGTLSRGCELTIRNGSGSSVDAVVDFRDRAHVVALSVNTSESLRLCRVGPFGYPEAVIAVEGREPVSVVFDRYCSGPVVVVEALQLRVEPKACA